MSTAAIAAAAMAALTASQAPGIDFVHPNSDDDGARGGLDEGPGDDSYYTELPPLASPDVPGEDLGAGPAESGIPATVLAAYKKAERALAGSDPGCALPWELLAAIGKVESGQARGGAVDSDGTTLEPILGPVLNGAGFARINDTDRGVHDGNTKFDRAVGPMQFIPSTWANWGADGNGDGRRDPNNIFDAALAAGEYLCAGERNLSVKADLDRAILSYNNSQDYLFTVLAWLEFYRSGVHEVPDGKGLLPSSPPTGGGDGRGTLDGSGKDGDGPAGSGGDRGPRDPAGSGPDGPGGTDPRDPDGSDPDGSNPDGSGPDGSDPDGSDPGGSDPGGSDPGGSDPDGSDPGGDSGPQDPGGSDPDGTDPDPDDPSPEPAPAALERVGAAEVTATAGGEFADRLEVKVTTEDGAPVEGVDVRYAIEGETAARFPDSATQVTATTNSYGVATAPTLHAGDKTGTFTVRATAVDRDLPSAEFTATVEAPKADELSRTSETGQQAETGGSFAERVEVKATYQGEAVACAAVDATLRKANGDALAAGEGPYFLNDEDERVHTLENLKTDENGLLLVPEIHPGGRAGTYELLLTTAGGGIVTVELKVS